MVLSGGYSHRQLPFQIVDLSLLSLFEQRMPSILELASRAIFELRRHSRPFRADEEM
jgi:hypothetical protein